ncbi:MAG: single-stranded-DNA-specific exonuclease RecJ [Planctomycetaceae bacterium]|nr:single-stranded-DNA-specific exonuclease RecJ [Planctomycetaceae bacterium]
MPRHWRFAPHDRAVIGRVAQELNCSPLLAEVLVARGLTSGKQAREFVTASINDLYPPDLLPGLAAAADRIVAAVQAGRRVTIYGDYDVDGVTSTSILWHCLKLAGAQVDYYIPCRLEEGYGLNIDAIRQLHSEDPERLVVTVDCGICSVDEAALSKELGLELIITDHHTMGETLPDAAAIVHPRLPGHDYPFVDLCGAGVAFKLAWGICQRLGDGTKASPRMREFLKSSVGLAAMGTVADVVPLVGENRIIVRYGLSTLVEKSTPGLSMLLRVAGLEKTEEFTAEDIGFGLAPRINAAGRLGQARLAVELLTTDNRARAAQLADYVDQLNKNRQTVERKIFKQAKEMVAEHPEWEDHSALVLASPDWHPGVIGIIASRLAEHFERPTIMIAINSETNVGQGSGRSYANYDLHSGIAGCSDLLIGFGGHRAAAGLRIAADRIDEFREAFSSVTTDNHAPTKEDTEVAVDAEINLEDLTHKAVKELEWLGPFGAAHRRPIFCSSPVHLVDAPSRMGGGDRHLSMRVRQGQKVYRCVAFGKGDWVDEIAAVDGPLSICFSAGLNRYRGYESVELNLIDWKPAPAPVVRVMQ